MDTSPLRHSSIDIANRHSQPRRRPLSAAIRSVVILGNALTACWIFASCGGGQSTYPFGPYVDHAAVRGIVRDAAGNPISGAVVTVTVTDNATLGPDITTGRAETGSTGAYRMTVERMGPNTTVPNPPETQQGLVSVTRSGGGLTSAVVVLRFGPKGQPAPEAVADIVYTP